MVRLRELGICWGGTGVGQRRLEGEMKGVCNNCRPNLALRLIDSCDPPLVFRAFVVVNDWNADC